jgi:hypothetical protein
MSFPSFSVGEVLTAADMNAVGLWKVGTATATYGTTTQLNINDVFTSNYSNYRIVISSLRYSVANTTLSLQLLKAGTPANGANYDFAYRGLGADGTVRDTNSFNQTSLSDLGCFNGVANNYAAQVSFDIITPAVAATTTTFLNIGAAGFATYFFTRNGAAIHNVANNYDGIRLFPSAGGNFGAEVRVYGYRN